MTVWVQYALDCSQQALPGPPAGEPIVTTGPTALVAGLFLAGGPVMPVSDCRPRAGVPSPGSLTVTDTATGTVVATRTLARGELATFPLPPGTYAIHGSFGDATANGSPFTADATATVTAGHTVRQDVLAAVP